MTEAVVNCGVPQSVTETVATAIVVDQDVLRAAVIAVEK